MTDQNPDFNELDNLIQAYLSQDMDMIAETVPEAIAEYVRTARQVEKDELLRDMENFIHRYHNNPEAEFERRWGFDHTPDDFKNQTTAEFFDMIRAILADPACCKRYLSN